LGQKKGLMKRPFAMQVGDQSLLPPLKG